MTKCVQCGSAVDYPPPGNPECCSFECAMRERTGRPHRHRTAPEIVVELHERVGQLEQELGRMRDYASANAHVILECGCVPGVTSGCRCEECRFVAARMAEAGYLDRVQDRWWEEGNG